MLSELTASQFAEWEAFASIEPFGPLREEYRFGAIAATIANAAPFRGKNAKVFRPSDFSDPLAADRPAPTAADVAAKANAFFTGIGGLQFGRNGKVAETSAGRRA